MPILAQIPILWDFPAGHQNKAANLAQTEKINGFLKYPDSGKDTNRKKQPSIIVQLVVVGYLSLLYAGLLFGQLLRS